MKNFIFALLIFQISPKPVGIVTGVVNGPNGMPASGVRVFAIDARDAIDPVTNPIGAPPPDPIAHITLSTP